MKNETVKLLEDRVAIRPDAPETKTDGGIVVPSPQAKGRGTVVACGPGKRITGFAMISKTTVKVGDIVLYGRFTGGEVTINGESLLLMRECDIVAVVASAMPIENKIDEGGIGNALVPPRCRCGKVDKTKYPDCKTMYDACCGADCDCTHSADDTDSLDEETL